MAGFFDKHLSPQTGEEATKVPCTVCAAPTDTACEIDNSVNGYRKYPICKLEDNDCYGELTARFGGNFRSRYPVDL